MIGILTLCTADMYFQVKENEDIMQTVVTSDNNYVVCSLFQACHAYPIASHAPFDDWLL